MPASSARHAAAVAGGTGSTTSATAASLYCLRLPAGPARRRPGSRPGRRARPGSGGRSCPHLRVHRGRPPADLGPQLDVGDRRRDRGRAGHSRPPPGGATRPPAISAGPREGRVAREAQGPPAGSPRAGRPARRPNWAARAGSRPGKPGGPSKLTRRFMSAPSLSRPPHCAGCTGGRAFARSPHGAADRAPRTALIVKTTTRHDGLFARGLPPPARCRLRSRQWCKRPAGTARSGPPDRRPAVRAVGKGARGEGRGASFL